MKKAIQFGAGNIGRGFIGLVLEKAGYHVVFADINQQMIDRLNADKGYVVHVMDEALENNYSEPTKQDDGPESK